MVLICISLIISGIDHLYMYLFAILISSLDNVYRGPLFFFKSDFLKSFVIDSVSSLYILNVYLLSAIWFAYIL